MTISPGKEVYSANSGSVIALGVSTTEQERDAGLDGAVRALIQDEAGKKQAKELAASLDLTDFEKTNLDEVLNRNAPLEDWRVGEAYGEAYLSEHRKCEFPWPDKWDERKSGSSLPGADLAGFQETDHETSPYRFAFGEVKTSSDNAYPPGAMYGRTGLKKQMEDLRDAKPIRDDLFRYLAMRAQNAAWKPKWQSAAKRYLANSTDVAIIGILVRDVPPNSADLSARSKALAKGCPAVIYVELLAIYFPGNSIVGFAKFYLGQKEGDHVGD